MVLGQLVTQARGSVWILCCHFVLCHHFHTCRLRAKFLELRQELLLVPALSHHHTALQKHLPEIALMFQNNLDFQAFFVIFLSFQSMNMVCI